MVVAKKATKRAVRSTRDKTPRAKSSPTGDAPSGKQRFSVAFSFPGTKREYVKQVAEALLPAFGGTERGRAVVFYDEWHESRIIGYNTNRKLQKIYAEEADLVVPFYCRDYKRKKWCGVELRAIESLLQDKKYERVMPFRFDKVAIPSSFATDVFPIVTDRPVEDVASLILERYRLLFPDKTRKAAAAAKGKAKPPAARVDSALAPKKPANPVEKIPDEAVKTIRDLLSAEEMKPLRERWSADNVAGAARDQIHDLIIDYENAIEAACAAWKGIGSDEKAESVLKRCRGILATLFQTAIDEVAVNARITELKKSSKPLQVGSASGSVAVYAVMSNLDIWVAGLTRGFEYADGSTLDWRAVTPGVFGSLEARLHKELWDIFKPDAENPVTNKPLVGQPLRELKSALIYGAKKSNSRITMTSVGSVVNSELETLAAKLGLLLITRTEESGPFFIKQRQSDLAPVEGDCPESNLNFVVRSCLKAIKRIKF